MIIRIQPLKNPVTPMCTVGTVSISDQGEMRSHPDPIKIPVHPPTTKLQFKPNKNKNYECKEMIH